MPVIDMSSNPCERQHTPRKGRNRIVTPTARSERLVWIKDGLAPRNARAAQAGKARTERLHLTSRTCRHHGKSRISITNDDPVNHNVHAECEVNQAWNESQPPRAEHKFKKFSAPEVMFPVTCSVHPWMRAYIAVSPHPFFAVTGDDGAFTLKGVPPGTYTIEAVHEKFGKKRGQSNARASGAATLDFTYGS